MEWYEQEVAQFEAVLARKRAPQNAALFYGSSTIRLWHSLATDLRNSRAFNLGFGGSTLAACVYFFERLVPPAQPCSLVVYAGDNDLGDGRKPHQVLESFEALTKKVNRDLHGIEMAFISIKPSPARVDLLDDIRETNRLIQTQIAQRKQSYYIDVFHAMLTPAGRPRRELFTADGLHMNAAGYRLWTEVLLLYRHRIFTNDCPSRKPERLS